MIPAMGQPQLRANLRAWVTDNARELMRHEPDPDAPLDPPAYDRLHEIKVPTLVLVGALDTPDIREIVERIDRYVCGARRLEYEKVGHIINLEADRRFNADVLAFLRGVP
jgi:pimeloyl-ACP methyl ester carboxylesterase